ncbi:ATP-binding protein [Streptomyces sp. NBC_01261]|uniref:ATP-binding protein n=1 Tax=Streptomyces sp. NBC_01261 TaxID=2903802 RepID=UPI002E3346C0|nr:ATP-binding protein [Streptomyces sp. NBC_01261]
MPRPLEESPHAFTVPALVEEVAAARDRVADRARGLGLDLDEELIGDLKLLTGELVANSVTHTQAECVVYVRWTGERLRVEVTDVDSTLPVPTHALSTDENGRGLFLVAAMATEWGSQLCATGKKTWFELAVPVSGEDTTTVTASLREAPAELALASGEGGARPALVEPVPIAGEYARAAHQAA